VEVAESSLLFDRRAKGGLYARAGVPDFWVVNLIDRVLEVYRTPVPAPDVPFGWAFQDVRHLGFPESEMPLAAPRTVVLVADLLP
jgi:Uma2 family endonuclease